MAMMSTSSPAELITQFQSYFKKELLPRARHLTVLDQFAVKSPFPKNAGAKTIRMHRKLAGAASNVAALTEGVPPTTYREVKLEYVEATLAQYGEVVKITDVMGLTELFSTLEESKDSLAEDAALHADSVVRNMLAHPSTGATKSYAGGATSHATLVALSASAGAMTIQDLLHEMTALKLARAPRKNGDYFAIVPPQISYDLMLDTKFFIPVNTYQDKTNVVKGEVGKWFGVRIVETTVPMIELATEGTYDDTGTVFTVIITGMGGYGTPIMAGNSPYDPQVIINMKPDKSDPLNQFVIAGFKTYWASLVLNKPWVRAFRVKSTYV
jgi:N4-gp56 family major capsid protein